MRPDLFESLAWLIPLLPLVACGILLGWGVRLHRTIGDRVALIAVVGIAIPCVIAWGILSSRVNQTFRSTPEEGLVAETGGEEVGEELAHGPDPYEMSIEWAVLGRIGQRLPTAKGTFDGKLRVGFYIDNLAAAMLAMVTLISTLIMIYSIGYMHGDERFPRFFAYMSLFCFAMLLLVLANSFVVLFAGWELVGLCSYLLIGFWYERRSAANAAKKAFIVNRVGDFGFLIGIMIVFFHVPSLNIRETLASVATPAFPLGWAAVAGMCLFAGAIGKSAQFPLHVWLPDAMEGPTPVSALIHAATMVAAGVYMVARIAGFYTAVHAFPGPPTFMGLTSLEIVRYIGIITALLAATIGVAQNDIKRVLAYSTVSQLGFMMFGLGMGVFGFVAGIFHLLTHAFFKALLFLGSGSVIHGCGGEQDMRRMGGLRSSMPVTFWTFLMGTLALTGVPFFFSGFWSKDEIMAAAWTEDKLVFWLGEMAAFFTALYMGRLVFLTFGGDHPRDESIHPHESPQVMTIPLIILAVFAVGLGWLGIPGDYNVMEKFLHSSGPAGLAHPSSDFVIAGIHFAMVPLVVSIMAAGLGWLLAAVIWGWKLVDVPALKRIFPPLAWAHTVLKNKYYFDEIYQATFVRGTVALAYAVGTFDRYFIDGIVNAVGWVWGFALTWITRLIDTYVVDGVVNLIGETQKWAGRVVTILQTGRVQQYIAMSALAAALIVAVIYLLGVYSVS